MKSNQQYYFHNVISIRLYIPIEGLTFKASENNILWCYHLHEASFALLLHGIYYLAISYRTNSRVWAFFGGLMKVSVHFSFETDFERYRLLLC